MSGADFIWTWQETLLSVPLGLIVLLTILGNFHVLYSFCAGPSGLRLPTHYLIANLALADFLVGVLCLPFLASYQVTLKWYFGPTYCETWTVLHFWLCSASILSTLGVCIERYVAVGWPMEHKIIMNRKLVSSLITVIWTCSGILTFTSLYLWPQPKTGNEYACEINQQIGHVLVAVVGMLYVPAVAMMFLYWRIFVIASRHLKYWNNKRHNSTSGTARFSRSASKSISEEQSTSTTSQIVISTASESEATSGSGPDYKTYFVPSSGRGNSNHNEKEVEDKKQITLAKRLTVLVAVLLISYTPFFTLYMVMAFLPEGAVDMRIFFTLGWIRYSNSCVNPFLYAWAVPVYRKEMKKVLGKCWGKLRQGLCCCCCVAANCQDEVLEK